MSQKKPIYKIDIKAISGNGGNGCISFRREKRIAKGGPDGGNGGNGGSIFLQGDKKMLTLLSLQHKRHYRAKNGADGSSSNKTGKSAEDLIIKVPYGTEVWINGEIMHDIVSDDLYEVAKGGIGGLGNVSFAAPDLTTPYISTRGSEGSEVILTLILKYMADVGVIGLPNSGKSTLVAELSNAKVRIGDYAFSTIEPTLGVAEYNKKKIVFADLPGLIEGSHNNIGLGHEFLQHLLRCKILLHMIDASSDDPMQDFNIIREEIRLYKEDLLKKDYFVCLSKIDLITSERLLQLKKYFAEYSCVSISQLKPESIQELLKDLSYCNFKKFEF